MTPQARGRTPAVCGTYRLLHRRRKMQSRLMRVAAADALFICIGASTALGASVTQPGELVGIPAGTPLPTDLTRPIASYQKQSQFAVGGPWATTLARSSCRPTPRRKWLSTTMGPRHAWLASHDRSDPDAGGCATEAPDHESLAEPSLVECPDVDVLAYGQSGA
jgi:hypothetical protein